MKKLSLVLILLFFSINSFTQSRYISETTKKIIYTRDGGKCQCCGSFDDLEYDHIIPYSCGGSSDASNIQLLCLKCNRSKSNSCFCKLHDKKVGNNCCDRKSNINETSNFSVTTSQCTGTTKKGARCRNMTTNSNGRCYLH
jgi:hypothetical protein